MSKKSPSQILASVAPPPPPMPEGVEDTVDDLTRILDLPARPVVDCQRDPVTKLYPPATEALIRIVTAKYSRGERVSCACRPRQIFMEDDGSLIIFRVLPEGMPPEEPVTTTVAAFVDDNQASDREIEDAEVVKALRPGGSIDLPAADGSASGHPCISKLNATQAWTLYEAAKVGGIIGFCNVGSGKTISGILAPLAFTDCKKAVLLAEPSQVRHYHVHYLRVRCHFRVPSINLGDSDWYTVPGTPPLHFVPYSKLSQPTSTDLLDRLDPDTIIADECHRIASATSSRTRRVLRLFASRIRKREADIVAGKPVRNQATRLLVWSGTFETKSVKDTQPLSTYALGMGSPLPVDPSEADAWSAVMDPSKMPDRTSSTARKLQEAFAGEAYDPESISNFMIVGGPEDKIREGFRNRRSETLGVISTGASSIGASIYVKERPTPKMPEAIRKAIAMVRAGERPDGDILIDQSEIVRCVRHTSSGYYYRWVFRKEDSDELIADWYAKRKLWNKELRDKLTRSEVHMDSPLLCENAAKRFWQESKYEGDLPTWSSTFWPAWAEIQNKVTYTPDVVWIDEYLAASVAEWVLKHRGVCWYLDTPFGQKIASITGLPCHGGGPDAEANIMAERGDRSIIASIAAHGAGRDGLQRHFNEQLVPQVPSSNGRWEQLFGRLHREGQTRDEVVTEIMFPVSEAREALRKAIAEAEFIAATVGNQQKLLFADFDFEP